MPIKHLVIEVIVIPITIREPRIRIRYDKNPIFIAVSPMLLVPNQVDVNWKNHLFELVVCIFKILFIPLHQKFVILTTHLVRKVIHSK